MTIYIGRTPHTTTHIYLWQKKREKTRSNSQFQMKHAHANNDHWTQVDIYLNCNVYGPRILQITDPPMAFYSIRTYRSQKWFSVFNRKEPISCDCILLPQSYLQFKTVRAHEKRMNKKSAHSQQQRMA